MKILRLFLDVHPDAVTTVQGELRSVTTGFTKVESTLDDSPRSPLKRVGIVVTDAESLIMMLEGTVRTKFKGRLARLVLEDPEPPVVVARPAAHAMSA